MAAIFSGGDELKVIELMLIGPSMDIIVPGSSRVNNGVRIKQVDLQVDLLGLPSWPICCEKRTNPYFLSRL